MTKGYNIAYDLMLQVLKSEPNIRAALVAELQKLPVDEKVLRFPGGTVSRSWVYDQDDVDLWVAFCQDSGVEKQTYVWNINGEDNSSLAGLQHLDEHFEIQCIEVGNEENYHQRYKGFWHSLVHNNSFFAERYYRPRGQAYGRTFNHIKSVCIDNGFGDTPIAAVFGTPNALAHRWWNKGVKDTAPSVTDIVIHNYRKFSDKNFMDRLDEAMLSLLDYKWWFTEINMDYERGKYYYKRFSEEHKEKLLEYIGYISFHDNCQIIQVHSLYKNNGFGRFLWVNGELIDNYLGWNL